MVGEERPFRLAPPRPFSVLRCEFSSFSVFSLTLWLCLFQVSTHDGTNQGYGNNDESTDSIPKPSKKNGERHAKLLPGDFASKQWLNSENGSTEICPHAPSLSVADRHVWNDLEWLRSTEPLRLDGEDIEIVKVMKERSWQS